MLCSLLYAAMTRRMTTSRMHSFMTHRRKSWYFNNIVYQITTLVHLWCLWCGWGFNNFMYIKNIVHPAILLFLQQKDDICFSSIMPAHMLPELLNMVCKMFNNFPAWHERQKFLSIEQIFFSDKTIITVHSPKLFPINYNFVKQLATLFLNQDGIGFKSFLSPLNEKFFRKKNWWLALEVDKTYTLAEFLSPNYFSH